MSIQSVSKAAFQKRGVIGGIRRCLLPAAAAMACHPAFADTTISEVLVINDPNGQAVQLRIEGEGFGSDPQVNLGNYLDPLIVSEFTCDSNLPLAPLATECLIADLPGGIEDGDFLLSMTRMETGCEGEKPNVLSFVYVPDSCDATSNYQEGKFECSDSGLPSGIGVNIELVKHANKIDVLPVAPDVLYPGDVVSFTSNEKHLKSELKFDIKEDGSSVQSLNIHASCSKPLAVGDVFGSLELVEYMAGEAGGKEKGKGDEENSAVYDLSIGAIGPVGPQGEIGPAGNDGTDGLAGAEGPQGPAGADGAPGADGNDGAPGANGIDGAAGVAGPAGANGSEGPAGADGADSTVAGPQGPQGPSSSPVVTRPVSTRLILPGESANMGIQCPVGTVRTGGGYEIIGQPSDPRIREVFISRSLPSGSGWNVFAYNGNPFGQVFVTVHVLCLNTS